MRKVLIISPYFPPTNAADMQRVRTSLPYFEKFGWMPEVVCIDESYSDLTKDLLLLKSIPKHIKIHTVKAFSKKLTSKIGLGSIALRSMWFYRSYVDRLLKKEKFDLIYFSTTQFPICILGKHWKTKFGIPYVIDMQDPWHSDYYLNKPKHERPPKYWFSYRLNKYLEPIAMKSVDGLISVTNDYIKAIKDRYPIIKNIPSTVIPFGANKIDYQIANDYIEDSYIDFDLLKINIVYTGAVGSIMKESISFLCEVLAHIKIYKRSLYDKFQFYFIGTSYASVGTGIQSVIPIAEKFDVQSCIIEETDRIGYFKSLFLLKKANALLIIGSDDISYNPSKIFTYALAERPILGIFKSNSKASKTVKNCSEGIVVNYDVKNAANELELYLEQLQYPIPSTTQKEYPELTLHSAEELTKKQCELFNKSID
jgi:hypothetical protein